MFWERLCGRAIYARVVIPEVKTVRGGEWTLGGIIMGKRGIEGGRLGRKNTWTLDK
jgi:hypothetical protein